MQAAKRETANEFQILDDTDSLREEAKDFP